MSPNKYFDTYLKLEDGVKLFSRIWIPSGNEGPWPALLMRQPYGKEIASTITYAHPTWWASKGFMVIVQDVRGQGESEGTFRGFSQEARDTSETHEWVRSLKECNGKLGLYGFSYQGLTQLTGKEDSKPPDCLSPAMTGFDVRNHWCSDGGAFWWHNNISWALQLAALKMKRDNNFSAWEEIRTSIEDKSHLKKGLNLIKKYDPENFIINWIDALNGKTSFEEIELLESWMKKPMLILGGLWDPHLKGALDLYKKAKNYGGNPQIIISNSTHLNWWKNSQTTLLNFFEKYLKNRDSQKLNKNKLIWNITLNTWEDIEKRSLNYKFGFDSDGNANNKIIDGSLLINSLGSGFATIVHDPWRPVPSDGGHLGPNPGPFNRESIDQRSDIAVFQTHFLKENIQISGIPILKTSVLSNQESFDICLALSLVEKEKKSVQQFSTGFLRIKNLLENKPVSCTIEFQPTNISIPKGSKLRLSVSASAWPSIGINPGYTDGEYGHTTMNHKIITLNFDLKKTFMKIDSFFG